MGARVHVNLRKSMIVLSNRCHFVAFTFYGKCDARNDGRNETCSKCRPSNGREMQRGRRRSSSDDEYERTNKRDRDQLGSSRASSDGENGDKGKKRKSARSRSASPVPPPKPIKDASQWPPRFESHGSRYVFDTRSEMFYEAISDFFYDPKSKLYYGNKQGAYFKKNEGGDDGSPSFIEVEKVATDAASQSTDLCVTRPSETISAEGRKRIAINLKTKALGGESSATGARAKGKAFAPKTHKKQMANIAKWNIQEKSKRDELVAAKPLANKVGEKIVRTVKGEPVCVLCQRKFKSLEKLRLHERLSRMHGANLAKQALDQADGKRAAGRAQAKPAQSYVDRAQKRRDLHFGTDSNFVAQASPLGPTMMFADVPIKQESDPESPERDGLGMGKRMLEKLGWKQEPTEDDDGGAPAVKVKVESTHDRIRKDWDRIESLANK